MNDLDVAKKRATDWLNSLGGETLDDDYLGAPHVLYDSGRHGPHDDRIMLIRFDPDDDGGHAMMFYHVDSENDVIYAMWYFDTTWGEMKELMLK